MSITEKLEKKRIEKEKKLELHNRLNYLFNEEGLKNKDIGDVLGISEFTVSKMKNNENFSITLERVEMYLEKLK